MAKERGVFQLIFRDFIASLTRKSVRPKLIGEDFYGTKYYEQLSNTKKRPARYFVPRTKDKFDAELPAEWESWLRHRRKIPPTKEEVEENYRIALMKKKNAAELEAKYRTDSGTGELGQGNQQKTPLNFPIYEDYLGKDK